MTTRRNACTILAALGVQAALPAFAQQPGKVWRIGYLSTQSGFDEAVDALRGKLRELGYVEGRNVVFEYRWAAGKEERVQELADELVRLKVDVIVTRTTFVAAAAKRATGVIPIVMAAAADPVALGVVASLARPGGNVTGMTSNATEIDAKRLQLLRELVPKVMRVATLAWEKSLLKPLFLEQIRTAATRMGITLIHREVGAAEALAGVFAAMQRERAEAVIVQSDPFTNNHRQRIAELAVQHRLPTMFQGSHFVSVGGLMSYGTSSIESHRHAATYVDRILKGAKPADLPVEEPTQLELVINLKTAKALGITVPQSILLRADRVIE